MVAEDKNNNRVDDKVRLGIVHRKELNSVLSTINGNRADSTKFKVNTRDIEDIFNEKGFLSPENLVPELLKKRYEKLGLEDFAPNKSDDRLVLNSVMANFHKDKTTNYYQKNEAIYGMVELYDNLPKKKAVIVEIDISNMGKERFSGANGAVGRENVDKLFKIIADIYLEEFQREAGKGTIKNGIDKVIGVREGGDELRIVAADIDERQAEIAREKAQVRVEKLSEKALLDALEHGKYKDTKPWRDGFSVGAGIVKAGIYKSLSIMRGDLERGIGEHKDDEGIKRKERVNARELKGEDVFRNTSDFTENRKKWMKVLKEVFKTKAYKNSLDKKVNNIEFPYNREISKSLNFFQDPAAARLQKAYEETKNLPQKKVDIILGAADQYDATVFGVRKGERLTKDLQNHIYDMNNSNFQSVLKGNKPSSRKSYISHVEMTGLGVINNNIGSENANIVLEHVVKIINEELNSSTGVDTRNQVYYSGNGKFKVISHGEEVNHDEIKKALSKIVKRVDNEINKKENLKEYLIEGGVDKKSEELGKLPKAINYLIDPKDPSLSGITIVTHTIETVLSSGSTVKGSLAIAERNLRELDNLGAKEVDRRAVERRIIDKDRPNNRQEEDRRARKRPKNKVANVNNTPPSDNLKKHSVGKS